MNPALIKLSGRTYRSRSHTISYRHFYDLSDHISSSEFRDYLVKPLSSAVQFITILLTLTYPCF